jgi:hypothetical protein
MEACLVQALNGITSASSREVIDLFQLVNDRGTPTPRRVIRFVNAFAAFWQRAQQLKDGCPTRAIVYLAWRTLWSPTEEIQREIQSGDTIAAPIAQHENDRRFEVWIAALLFYQPYERAIEWWLKSAVRAALVSGNLEEVKRLSELPEFQSALDAVDYTPFTTADQHQLFEAVNTLVDSQVEDGFSDQAGRRGSLEVIRSAIGRVGSWELLATERYPELAVRALRILKGPGLSLQVLERTPIHTSGALDTAWMAPFFRLLDGLAEDPDQLAHLRSHYRLPLAGDLYLAACLAYGQYREEAPGHVIFRPSNDQLVSNLLRDIIINGRPLSHEGYLRVRVATASGSRDLVNRVWEAMPDALNLTGQPWDHYRYLYRLLGQFLDTDAITLESLREKGIVGVRPALIGLAGIENPTCSVEDLFWVCYFYNSSEASNPGGSQVQGEIDGWKRITEALLSGANGKERARELIKLCAKRSTYGPLRAAILLGEAETVLIEAIEDPGPGISPNQILAELGGMKWMRSLPNGKLYVQLAKRIEERAVASGAAGDSTQANDLPQN